MRLGASERWRFCYKWLTRLQVLAALVLSAVSVAAKYELPAGFSGLWYDSISFIQEKSIFGIITANFFLWSAHCLKSYFGNPWAWDSVKVLLEEFRSDVFKGEKVTANHDRVTLFKKRERRWRFGVIPSNDWLCAVERTGHMTRRRRKWFRVNDDGRNYDGVAGATWCLGRTTLKTCLPPADSEAGIDYYAKETFVHVSYVKRQLQKKALLPKSLCGIIVEVNNKPWGVIVIDSSLETMSDQKVIEAFYKKMRKFLESCWPSSNFRGESEFPVNSSNIMNDWVKIDTAEINKEIPQDVQGVTVKVSFSPYDVPQQWRYYREPNSNFFIIEFRYLLDEVTRSEKTSPEAPIEFEVGKNSQRIYKIKIDVIKLGYECTAAKLEVLARNVVGAIQDFKKTVPLKFRDRYKMPENVVFNNRSQIFSSIAG